MTVKPKANLVLDTVILILFLLALISGLLLEYVYPHGGYRGGRGVTAETTVLGLTRTEMDDIHLYGALAASALVGVHLLLHARWIACQVRRLLRPARPAANRVYNQDPDLPWADAAEAAAPCRPAPGAASGRR